MRLWQHVGILPGRPSAHAGSGEKRTVWLSGEVVGCRGCVRAGLGLGCARARGRCRGLVVRGGLVEIRLGHDAFRVTRPAARRRRGGQGNEPRCSRFRWRPGGRFRTTRNRRYPKFLHRLTDSERLVDPLAPQSHRPAEYLVPGRWHRLILPQEQPPVRLTSQSRAPHQYASKCTLDVRFRFAADKATA